MIDLLKFYRVKDWIKNFGICLIGFLVAKPTFNLLIFQQFILSLIVVSLAYAYAFSINDFFDYKISKEVNYIGKLAKRYKEKLMFFLCFIPLFFFFLIFLFFGGTLFYLLILFIFLYSLYSIPPLRLKKYYFFSIPINAICIGFLTYLFVYFLFATKITFQVIFFSIIFCSYIVFHEIIHQIVHKKKDKIASIFSLPNVIGVKKSLKVATTVEFIPILTALIILILNTKNFVFLGTILFSSLRILKVNREKLSKKIRDKVYGIYEGLFYVVGLIINQYIF